MRSLLAQFLLVVSLLSVYGKGQTQPTGLRTSGFPIFKGVPKPETERISRAPKKFTHPRIFFSPEDLPQLRKLLLEKSSIADWKLTDHDKNSPVAGAAGLLRLKHILLGTDWTEKEQFSTPLFTGPYKPFYNDLLKSSKAAGSLDVTLEGLKKRYGKNVELHSSNVAENGFGHRGMYGKLSGAAFVALITEGEEPFNAKELGKVLGATCRHHRPVWKSSDPREFGFFHDSPMDLGLAYDWLYNDMEDDDISECRSLIATMTGGGRREFGAQYLDFPWTGFNWNWIGWHEHIVSLAASIDGEHPDSDFERWADDCVLVQKRWYQLESSEGGLAREGLGYHTLGLNGALPATAVIARSRENLFELEETRNALYRMVLYRVYTAAPWIDQSEGLDTESVLDSFSHGDNVARGRPRSAIVLRKFFPTDPFIAWGFKTSDFSVNFWEPLMSAVFATDSKPVGDFTNLEAIAKTVSLPENYFCRDRGEMIVRDHWKGDATMFDFEVKMNALSLGHNHADRNSFYLYSRGRAWIIDNKEGDTENIAHQTVLIDGLGQAGGSTPKGENTFPAFPGIFLEFSEGTNNGVSWASGVGSAKPAYDFAATCDEGAVAEGFKCVNSPYTRRNFTYPPAPYINMPRFPGLTSTWMDDKGAEYRIGKPVLQFNPVERAFRSTLFVKSKKVSGESYPWILIVDDIQKDSGTHKYEFIMNLPWADEGGPMWQYRHDFEKVVRDDAATSALKSDHDMILKDERDPLDSGPRLLVRVLRATGMQPDGFKYIPRREIQIRKAMGGHKRLARHLVIETLTVSPDFCVFLYPHNQGDELPITRWMNDQSELSVEVPDADITKWSFSKLESGRTRITPLDSAENQTVSLSTNAPNTSSSPAGFNNTATVTMTPTNQFLTDVPASTATRPASTTSKTIATNFAATQSHSIGETDTTGVSTTQLSSGSLTGNEQRSTEPATQTTIQAVFHTVHTSELTKTSLATLNDDRTTDSGRLPRTTTSPVARVTKDLVSSPIERHVTKAHTTSSEHMSEEAGIETSKSRKQPLVENIADLPNTRTPLTTLDLLEPHFVVVKAGSLGDAMATQIKLENVTTICPADYRGNGFTVLCVLPPLARDTVELLVNGNLVRTERHAPYSISGDSVTSHGGRINPWVKYPKRVGELIALKCTSSDGLQASVNVTVTCPYVTAS